MERVHQMKMCQNPDTPQISIVSYQ